MLVLSLIIAVGYIGYEKYTVAQQKEQTTLVQQGMMNGYEQAVVQLIQQAQTCQPVNVWHMNQSVEVIATKCLNKQGVVK